MEHSSDGGGTRPTHEAEPKSPWQRWIEHHAQVRWIWLSLPLLGVWLAISPLLLDYGAAPPDGVARITQLRGLPPHEVRAGWATWNDVMVVTPLRAIGRALSPKRRLVMVGAGKSSLAVLRRMIAASIRSRLLGQRMVLFVSSVSKPDLRTLQELAEQGLLRPAIDRRYSLSEAGEALTYVENGRARGKVVITL